MSDALFEARRYTILAGLAIAILAAMAWCMIWWGGLNLGTLAINIFGSKDAKARRYAYMHYPNDDVSHA